MAETAVDVPEGARSTSIATMLEAPEMAGAVTAADVARYLSRSHPSYAGGRAATWPVRWPLEGRRRLAQQWVGACVGLLAREPAQDEATGAGERGERVRRMTTRSCLLLLGLLDPPVGRAMLESGLTAALLAEYEPVRGQGQLPLATVLGPGAAQRAGAVPALATAYGLAEPDRWHVAGPHVSSSAPDPSFDAVAVGWAANGEPVVGLADRTVRARGAESAVAVPVAQRPWQVGIGADGPWAEPVEEERRDDTEAKFSRVPHGRPVSRSVLGGARVAIGGIGPGARPALTVTVGSESWHVPLNGSTPPLACAVSDDGGLAIAAYEDGGLVWVRRTGDVAGSAAFSVSPGRVVGRVVAVGTDSRGERTVVLGDDAVSVVTGVEGAGDSGSSLEPVVMLRIRRASEDQLAAALSPDGDRLAVLTHGSSGLKSVDVHDLRMHPKPVRAGFDNDLPEFDGDRPPPDHAGVGADVDALAMLLASTTLKPPLCLGLFGDWGSGKTWFMARLRSHVKALSREARECGQPQRDVEYWKRIVTVDFNAWTTPRPTSGRASWRPSCVSSVTPERRPGTRRRWVRGSSRTV